MSTLRFDVAAAFGTGTLGREVIGTILIFTVVGWMLVHSGTIA